MGFRKIVHTAPSGALETNTGLVVKQPDQALFNKTRASLLRMVVLNL